MELQNQPGRKQTIILFSWQQHNIGLLSSSNNVLIVIIYMYYKFIIVQTLGSLQIIECIKNIQPIGNPD